MYEICHEGQIDRYKKDGSVAPSRDRARCQLSGHGIHLSGFGGSARQDYRKASAPRQDHAHDEAPAIPLQEEIQPRQVSRRRAQAPAH